jgi:hypothetical protein
MFQKYRPCSVRSYVSLFVGCVAAGGAVFASSVTRSAEVTARDVVLHGEDVGQLAIVGLRPQMEPVGDLDQLRRDPHPVPFFADAAFEDRADVQLLADAPEILALALELKRRRARRDAEALDFGEVVEQLLRQPVGEVLLVLLRAHVDEGAHGDRRRRCRPGR